MRYILFFFLMGSHAVLHAQSSGTTDPLVGQYDATANGDRMSLAIEHKAGTSYMGVMIDSYQKYSLMLELTNDTTVSGLAKEYSLGLEFDVLGQLKGDHLLLNFTIEVAGEKNEMTIDFYRAGSTPTSTPAIGGQYQTKVSLPAGAIRPQEVTGTWKKEELYNSGSGDSFMGSSFTQALTFLADGSLSEGHNSAHVGGSNFSGQSSGQGTGVIQGVIWYTIGNQLYLQVTEMGQTQDVHLGRYFIENNNMLITGTNGEKILLKKSN